MRMNGPRGLCSRSVLCCLVGLRRLWVPTTTPARPEDCQSATTVNRTVCCNLHASEGARPPKHRGGFDAPYERIRSFAYYAP